jgi:hypothetical protein
MSIMTVKHAISFHRRRILLLQISASGRQRRLYLLSVAVTASDLV